MIVRTYGRRNRGIDKIYTDQEFNGIADTNFNDSSSQEIGKDAYGLGFSSQDSSRWSLASDSYAHFQTDDSDRNPNRKVKKSKKNSKAVALVIPTATLMETQEFGEMMEHTDEMNFALDGMRDDQPVRIKRASLLSLLAICSTAQQRRLLRTQGMAKMIIDAVIKLNMDDFTSNVAAATLFYAFTSDCQSDKFLESSDGIRFLLKLLKPVVSNSSKDKIPAIGSRLLGFRKDTETSHNTFGRTGTTSSAILRKVHEIVESCKDLKAADDCGNDTFELNPKWIALLAIERGSLSTITLEETADTISKSGGNFKEKLRENGGMKAVFSLALGIYSTIEEWFRSLSTSRQYTKVDVDPQCLAFLLKCLKIMENASFLSIDNQGHLLGMKADGKHKGLSFTEVILRIIKILSALLKNENSFGDAKSLNVSSKSSSPNKLSGVEYSEKYEQDLSIESNFSEKSTFGGSQELCNIRLDCHVSSSSTAKSSPLADTEDGGLNSSTSLSSSMVSKCSGSQTNIFVRKYDCVKDSPIKPKKEIVDPFAFDEVDFEPRKWDSSCDKSNGDYEDFLQSELITSQQESSSIRSQNSQENQFSNRSCGDMMLNLLSNCLIVAIKVLMNLTNDNSVGCQQIAGSGGLESMSSLIALHFHSFVSPSARNGIDHIPTVERLSDRKLDMLVAILGLLVNLVEKDGNNRTRLAELTVSLPRPDDLSSETIWDVITLICSVFLSSQRIGDTAGEESDSITEKNDEEGQMEAEKMIIEAYAALLLAFLSTQSVSIRRAITDCLPEHNLAVLVPVLERFVAFHLSLNMISAETHQAVSEVIESCKVL